MLGLNILIIQNICFHPIICSEIIKDEKLVTIDEQRDIQRTFLKTYLFASSKPKSTIFQQIPKSFGYDGVVLGHIQFTKPKMIEVWKKRLEGGTLIVTCKNTDTLRFETSYKLETLLSVKKLKYYLCMVKKDMLNIFKFISESQSHETIEFTVKMTDDMRIPFLGIKCISKQYVINYLPLLPEINSSLLKKIIEEELDYYYERYAKELFYFFRMIREKKESKKESKKVRIYNYSNDVIILHFTEDKIPLFLLVSKYIPTLKFFDDFSVKLSFCQREKVTYDKNAPISLKNIYPFICLRFIRFDDSFSDILNIQLTMYKQKEDSLGSFTSLIVNTSHLNLNFSSETTISFEKQIVEVYIEIRKGKSTRYDFSLYTTKASNKTPSKLNIKLLNSIKNIRIETFRKTKDARVELNIIEFSKEEIYDSVALEFTIAQDTSAKPNIANNILYNILERKNGFFSIQVQSIHKTLIEYKVNLDSKFMYVLSSNRLGDLIESSKANNDIS